MLFQKSSLLNFRFVLFIILSLLLMMVDYQQHGLQRMRSVLLTLVAPLQYTVGWPVEIISKIKANISSHQTLIEENSRLRAHALLLQTKIQRNNALQSENKQLHKLLQSVSKLGNKFMAARLLAVATQPNVAQIVLDKGSNHKIYEGQAVLDAHGVMGQVIQVGALTSRVMLLTDRSNAVPVQNARTGERGIVVGNGIQQSLALINVTDGTDLKEGDLLMTSGLGLRYPEGYPVGKIIKIKHLLGENFLQVSVKPCALLGQSRQVLLVWLTAKATVKEAQQQLRAMSNS